MKPRSLVAGILVPFCAVSLAWADEASKTAKVEEFFRLAKLDEMLRQTLALTSNQLKSGMLQQLTGAKLSPEKEKELGDFQDKITRVVTDALAWEKLKPGYVKLFSEAYTEAELDDIVAFYKSPTGQAMVAKSPSLMTKANVLVQAKIAEAQPELRKLIMEFAAQAGQHDADGAPADPKKK